MVEAAWAKGRMWVRVCGVLWEWRGGKRGEVWTDEAGKMRLVLSKQTR